MHHPKTAIKTKNSKIKSEEGNSKITKHLNLIFDSGYTSETKERTLRIDDYRFYGKICDVFGAFLLVIGIAVPLITMSYYTDFFGNTVYNIPYLNQGIVLVAIGIILIVLGIIFNREYRLRIQENQSRPVSPIPSPTP